MSMINLFGLLILPILIFAGMPLNQGVDRAPGIIAGPANPDSVVCFRNGVPVAHFYGPWSDGRALFVVDNGVHKLTEGLEHADSLTVFEASKYDFYLFWVDEQAPRLKSGKYHYEFWFYFDGDKYKVPAGTLTKQGKKEVFTRGGFKKG